MINIDLEDIDLEQEWEKFKAAVKDRPFSYVVAAAYYHAEGSREVKNYKLNRKILEIWEELGLIEYNYEQGSWLIIEDD